MCDREARDLARREKKGTPTPKKLLNKNSENKENEGKTCKARLNFPQYENTDDTRLEEKEEDDPPISDNRSSFDHPVYKDISRKNGLINRLDLSSMKRLCKEEGLDSTGKRDMVKQRLKQFYKTRMLREAGLLPASTRGYDRYLVVDFEATCEEKNSVDFPHEIIEFPGVLLDGKNGEKLSTFQEYVRPTIKPKLSDFCTSLTGINQETVDRANTFPTVLNNFHKWMSEQGLGTTSTFALVTDGPFDVGRFMRLSCEQTGLEVPYWATHWVNVRKGFANFYRTSSSSSGHLRLPGLSNMLDRLSLEFEGSPHSGLDDSINIARVVSRMVADGAVLKVNERIELELSWETESQRSKQLPHVVPVSRAGAEAWHTAQKKKVVK